MTTYKTIEVNKYKEGEFFIKWMENKLILSNKNVLSVEVGPTGSGKSYRDLRKAELWYEYHFKKQFPVENICFSIPYVMNLLAKGELKKGEVLVVEEVGVNLGNRDWQNKVSKMFNYILQSFRSMNLALFMNLPYLDMLDKQARSLLHYYSESVTIDKTTQQNICKPFFIQIAQGTGKLYHKYPKANINGKPTKVKRFFWNLPSKYLSDAYEQKKSDYLKSLTKDFSNKMGNVEEKTEISVENKPVEVQVTKLGPKEPSPEEITIYNRYKAGETQANIAFSLGTFPSTISNIVRKIEYYHKTIKNQSVLAIQ